MRFLLDTNVFSEPDKSAPSPKVLSWLTQNLPACGVPVIVLAERWRGALTAPERKRAKLVADLERFENEYPDAIVPIDTAAARKWADYVTTQSFTRQPKGYADSLIAAIALSRGLTVVTRDTDDFPGVPTINPFL